MLNISKIFGKFIRNSSQREIDQLKLIVQKINTLEPKIKEMSDKSLDGPQKKGFQRGDSKNNDWYTFTGITLSFKILSEKERCHY